MTKSFVHQGAAGTKIEWAHDSAWRFLPPVKDPDVGYRLHPIDLSINKVLALAGRDEPRDFIDVLYVHREHLGLGALCWAATGKDSGFSPELLVEMIARKGRYRPEDFAPLQLSPQPDLAELKAIWLAAVEEARALARTLPAADVGCLYLDPSTGKFVTPTGDLSGLQRHYGSLGGILPKMGDNPLIFQQPDARKLLSDTARRSPLVRGRTEE